MRLGLRLVTQNCGKPPGSHRSANIVIRGDVADDDAFVAKRAIEDYCWNAMLPSIFHRFDEGLRIERGQDQAIDLLGNEILNDAYLSSSIVFLQGPLPEDFNVSIFFGSL